MEKLKNVKVIIDVGAKDTTYPEDYPRATCHLFEPNKKHFERLRYRYKDNKNIVLNNYGLGDKEEELGYDPYLESCIYGNMKDYIVSIKTLNWYLEEHKINRLDFLKIDTEGMDLKVLTGGNKALSIVRYIQYEHWDDLLSFHSMLGVDFTMNYIGERNVFCKRK